MQSKIHITLLIIFSVIFFSFTDDPKKNTSDSNQPYQIATTDSKKMDGNNISTWYRNNGSFNRDPVTGNAGFEWPKGERKFARYASGLWIGAVVGDDTLMAIADYDYEYLPGYIDYEGNPQGKDDPSYRIYKINEGDSTSNDYVTWPVNQGAYTDANGKPFLIGKQTMFYSYTDGYPEEHGNYAGRTDPLKAQILQTNWCFTQQYGVLNDVVFTEYRIINRGISPWVNSYFAQWTDDDLGGASDDANGCDSILNLGYIYNFTNNDAQYGSAPPAVGFLFLKGPLVPSINDTAKFYDPPGSKNFIIKPGYKQSKVSSVNTLLKSSLTHGAPSNYVQTYYCLQGYTRNFENWISPITGNASKFPHSGDPEAGTGWLMEGSGDRRFMISVGPVSVEPGDTQSIITAQIITLRIFYNPRVRYLLMNQKKAINSPCRISRSEDFEGCNIYS